MACESTNLFSCGPILTYEPFAFWSQIADKNRLSRVADPPNLAVPQWYSAKMALKK
jgi:hypothetical protein